MNPIGRHLASMSRTGPRWTKEGLTDSFGRSLFMRGFYHDSAKRKGDPEGQLFTVKSQICKRFSLLIQIKKLVHLVGPGSCSDKRLIDFLIDIPAKLPFGQLVKGEGNPNITARVFLSQ